jgi:hypothetical protein
VFIRDQRLAWARNRTESRFAVKPGVGFAARFKPTEKERLSKRMILLTKCRESTASGHLKNSERWAEFRAQNELRPLAEFYPPHFGKSAKRRNSTETLGQNNPGRK